MRRSSVAWIAAAATGLAAGLGTLAIAGGLERHTTYAEYSVLASALTLAAGIALIIAGLIASLLGAAAQLGDLALLAGLIWFAPVWVGWFKGPPWVRSIGMLVAGFLLPLLMHLVLAAPSGRLRGVVTRIVVYSVYVETTLVAVGLALIRDPFFDPYCWANCSDNMFLISSHPHLARAIEAADRWFTAAAAAALVMVCAWRLLADSGPARRAFLPFALPAALLSGAVLAHVLALWRTPLEDPSDPTFRTIFIVECTGAVLLAAGLVWAAVRTRLRRRAVAHITASLGQAPAPGSVGTALGRAVGDPQLQIAYWLPDSQRYVDAQGLQIAEPAAAPGQTLTPLVREGRRIAMVSHSAAVPDLERAIGAAARLALENERLQAEMLAQLDQLRASRVRIVEIGDAERRQLERNLHDGAQQRLLALSYDVRLARTQAQIDGDTAAAALLTDATSEASAALSELRDLAHGIYPAILVEAGLGPAVDTLAEAADIPVEVLALAQGRYPASVETAAYLVVAEGIDDGAQRDASHVTIAIVLNGEWLMIMVEDDGRHRTSELMQLADRVGALEGRLIVEPTRLRAELPCG
jgi:signal transduction histidine kinase